MKTVFKKNFELQQLIFITMWQSHIILFIMNKQVNNDYIVGFQIILNRRNNQTVMQTNTGMGVSLK